MSKVTIVTHWLMVLVQLWDGQHGALGSIAQRRFVVRSDIWPMKRKPSIKAAFQKEIRSGIRPNWCSVNAAELISFAGLAHELDSFVVDADLAILLQFVA